MDTMTIIGVVLILGFGIVFTIAMIIQGNKAKKNISKTSTDGISTEKEYKTNKSGEIPKKDILNFMEFDRIVDDMILQEKESKYTMVIQCKGINYDLMSEIEQLSVEEGFITFLNTLKFPVQLYVQARAIDLKKSMEIYKENVDNISSQFNDAENRLKNVASNLNSTNAQLNEAKMEREKYLNMLEYANDIKRYMEVLSLNKHVLQRKFYVVISYYKSEVTATAEFTKEEIHEICHRELYTRAQTITSALSACSVSSRVLSSNELAELLYISYNRDDEKLIDIKTALDSGFYRLYSTSEDVYDKKQSLMQREIEEEAKRRVTDAIKEALEAEKIKTPDELTEEFEERTDREAITIVRDSDIDEESKDKLINIIAEKHVAKANVRKDIRRAALEDEQNNIQLRAEENDEQTEQIEPKEEDNNIDNQNELKNDEIINNENDSII